MNTIHLAYLFILLFALILLSAFFSASETGMMSLNRYRLRHLARKKHGIAVRVTKLLERTDRLLGVILIGNTFANILASAVATVIAGQLFGEIGILVSTIILTLIILIFAEVTPKTFAANYPQKVAFFAAWPLGIFLKLLYPIVWFANAVTNKMLKLFGVKIVRHHVDPLTREELQTVVQEASGHIEKGPQDMLLRVLELEKVTVDDVMVPRNDIMGIDLNHEWEEIKKQLIESPHTRLVLYRDDIDAIEGIVHLRKVLRLLSRNKLNKETLIMEKEEPYFVPESTPLTTQLLNFKREKRRSALVVDEYGDIQGLVTLEDVLEEIVGEFEETHLPDEQEIFPQKDGSYIVLGSANVRELNREMDWELPIEGPKTLNGCIVEFLEVIPTSGVCLQLNHYPIEVIEIEGNMVKKAKIFPKLRRAAEDKLEQA